MLQKFLKQMEGFGTFKCKFAQLDEITTKSLTKNDSHQIYRQS